VLRYVNFNAENYVYLDIRDYVVSDIEVLLILMTRTLIISRC